MTLSKSQAKFKIVAASGLHIGDKPTQQDQWLLVTHPQNSGWVLALVSDGMGGMSGGRLAADAAVDTARKLFEQFDPEQEDPQQLLLEVLTQTHEAIRVLADLSEKEPHCTIAVALVTPDGVCHWSTVGDSRLYHFRGQQLLERSKDHSVVQMLLDKGEIDEEQARTHPKSNLLLAALGAQRSPPMNVYKIEELQNQDTIFLCTDGVWHYFEAQELSHFFETYSPRIAANTIVQLARERAKGSGDNLCLIVLKVLPAKDEWLANLV